MSQRELRSITADGNYQMTTQLRSQVRQDPTQTSINLEQGAMDQQEGQARIAEGKHCYQELAYQHDSTVRELQQQIQMLSQDRDAYKQELKLMSMNFENFKVQSELERLHAIE